MTRNLDYRIEVGTRVLDPDLKKRIRHILQLQENDNCKARVLDELQQNVYAKTSDTPLRSQVAIRDYLDETESSLLKALTDSHQN